MESTKEEKFGKRFTYEVGFDGPVKTRSCTDVLCLALFAGIMIVWIYAIVQASMLGDLNLIDCLVIGNSSECTQTQNLRGNPILYVTGDCQTQNLSKYSSCVPEKVCLKKCRSSLFKYDNKLNETDDPDNWNINALICAHNITSSNANEEILIRNDYNACILNLESTNKQLYKLANIRFQQENSTGAPNAFIKENGFFTETFDDLMNCWEKILMFWGLAIVISVLYLIIIYFCLPLIIWITVFGLVVLLLFGATMAYMKYENYDASATKSDEAKYISSNMWLAIFILCIVLLLIFIIMLIVLRKQIKTAMILITESCRAMGSMFLSMFFPLLPIIICLGLSTIFVVTFMYLFTSKASKSNLIENAAAKEGSQYSTDDNNLFIALCSINIVSYVWSICFVTATSDLILSGVFAAWYWALDKSTVHNTQLLSSICRTCRYHLGTAAFGSLLITIFKLIRILLVYISKKLQYTQSICACCMWPLKCIVWIIENFLSILNRNGYIICSLHGTNYLVSARSAYNLLMRNMLRVVALSNIVSFIILLGELVVTLVVSLIAYKIFEGMEDRKILNNSIMPTFFVAIGSWIVAQQFFNLLDLATDTIFICFLEDCERNDGSPEKPYYMSTKLKKVLDKDDAPPQNA